VADETMPLRNDVAAKKPEAIVQAIRAIDAHYKSRGVPEAIIPELLSDLSEVLLVGGYRGGSLKGFAMAVKQNNELHQHRYQRRHPEKSTAHFEPGFLKEYDEVTPGSAGDPSSAQEELIKELAAQDTWAKFVERHLDRLSDTYREIVRLRYIENIKDLKVIGERVGLGSDIVKDRLRKARDRYLKEFLREELLPGEGGTLTRIERLRRKNPDMAVLADTLRHVPAEDRATWEKWLCGQTPKEIAEQEDCRPYEITEILEECLKVVTPKLGANEREILDKLVNLTLK
jgi:DNA-directed RNA polymerase specialized sigma24 family protein